MASIFSFNNSQRSIYLFDPIFSWTAESLIKDLLKMNSESKDEINIFINSPGGVVIDALGVIDVMNAIDSPINTIILGSAASAASLIAACGDKRYISENSEVMIHEAAMQGDCYLDTRDNKLGKALARLEQVNQKINSIYAAKTGKSLEEVNKVMATKEDIYMTAKEAIAFGLVDTILSSEELSKIKLSESFNNIKLSEKFEIADSSNELKKVHLLKTCSLADRGVEITEATLHSLKGNFEANVRGQDISIDYTHENDNGEKPAGAWIKSLSVEESNLYAMVEFTPLAEKMIKDKEFKYLSVEIDPLYQDEKGKMFSNVLLGGTFTNRPAVKGLDPIKLSETINLNKIEMQLSKEEIGSIEAVKAMDIKIEDFHKSFIQMKAENAALISEKGELEKAKVELEEKAVELEDKAKLAEDAIAKAESDKVEAEKVQAVDGLVEKGIIANSQKEKVLNKFSSKAELEDFYAGVPAVVKVKATGLDLEDAKGIDESKLEAMSQRTGHSVEDLKKYGLKQ
jgi:ATP-dependent Clp protease, protease subunit